MSKTFKVGEKYVIVGSIVPQPVVAEIFVLTNKPGKLIGMKLPYKIASGHSLDGRIEHGTGIWVHPQHLFTEDEHKVDSVMRQQAPQPIYSEMQELVFDEDTNKIVNLPAADVKEEPTKPVPPPVKAETKPNKPAPPTQPASTKTAEVKPAANKVS